MPCPYVAPAILCHPSRMFVTIPKLLRWFIPESHGCEEDGKQNRVEKRCEKASAQVQAHRAETVGRIVAGTAGLRNSRRDRAGDREGAQRSSRVGRRGCDHGRRRKHFSRRPAKRI